MKQKINKERVLKDFDKLKNYSKICCEKNNYAESFCAIETACKLMYAFNVIYTDDCLESTLSEMAANVLKDKKIRTREINSDRKILFYDYFPTDNRGLTQQYITALIELDYEILFVTYEQEDMKKSENIFLQLTEYEKAEIYTIKSKDYTESVSEVFDIVNNYGASKALLHMTPWDVVGVAAFSYFSNIERFLINLTDHTFWIGKCCSDYILEFRSYGYNVSRNYRNIPENKLLLLPYYPIQDLKMPFGGFPFDDSGKKVIFSGGSVYKIYGSNIFFDTIKHIIQKHEDTIVLYAGGGDTKPFENFIVSNHFEDRVFLIQERKDITQIFVNCYFYLGTYPVGGGLMTQFAVANKKIPLVFSNEKYKWNFIEPLFINHNKFIKTYTNLDEYFREIDKLIYKPEYKNEVENTLDELIITRKEFAEALQRCLKIKSTKYIFEKENIELDEFYELSFQTENYYLHDYYFIFIRSKNLKLILKFFNIELLKALIKVMINKFRRRFIS
ncbi:hypothetical protein [Acetobacterium woodii]|uniref:Uncharacterized protein n=1 Tax=Acetobacterium woodii (strain ATCC 29683 / DSM 1030 / JCM 2381 / KCTC 1655 / WB1) TaxID=931626 RepID=H6LBC0_ACEWD|nr:hypothetical protein [Acetobacterium woodii]AFA48875.1 hypothetical protein Awo_c20990 [Acetobacterium woodii DSM 1030]